MNTNNKFLGFFVLLLLSISVLYSCSEEDLDETINTETETLIFDCVDLEADFGDTCTIDTIGFLIDGIVNSACECEPTTASYDCPSLSLNIGDGCTTTAGEAGSVNSACECEPTVSYDCPSLFLNIGDVCYDSQGNQGTVDSNCNCDSPNSVDCPSWGLNIGDVCDYWDIDPVTMDTVQVQGILDVTCQCL